MPSLTLKPSHKAVVVYYDSLAKFEKLGIKYETAVRSAFQELLEICARQFDWKLVPEYPLARKGKAPLKADGALLDIFGLNYGLWEAKDSDDDLEKEIKNKFAAGYPRKNILFWQPARAVLFQNGERFYEADLSKPEDLVHLLELFFDFVEPAIEEWSKAVEEFKDKVPQIAASLKVLIEKERQTNPKFIGAFDDFLSLCRGSLNPNISIEAVEEMIMQHILTERIFRKIFAVADFIARNVIAQEIEKVITALNSRSFSRDDFSKSLEHFYGAIENAAATITDFHEKQTFLNTVYERFFQGFCVKVADTHGIVYTPQPLVNFMVASVEQVLKDEFGKSLADREVHILDPFTGTGNFIVNIMRHIPKSALPHKYASELHCNEVMLTYVADSKATLRNSLSDPYIKAVRYASDRIGDAGIVCYVTNNGFIEGIACDGVRKNLGKDFDLIYILDLGGNVRKNPKLSGTIHNVFGIQVGVSINIFIKLPRAQNSERKAKIFYHAVPIDWRREQKNQFLEKSESTEKIKWKALTPDLKHN